MTPQEQQLLTELTQRINQTQLQEKDPDAENLLGHELGANPDAIYILAQTVLVQDIALQQARAQMNQLQQQLQQAQQHPAHATSFLGRLLGEHDPQPPAPPPPQQPQGSGWQPVQQPAQPQYAPPQYVPQPVYGQPVYQQAQYVPMVVGQPSFLRGAMQTAAGVAAGALAFEGVESILHGFGGGYGPGMGMAGFGMGPGMSMGGGFERPVEETVVNNYYDQPGPMGGGEHHFEGSGQQFGGAQQFDNPQQFGGEAPHFHESADQGGAQFSDASYNTAGGDVQSGNDAGAGNDQQAFDQQMDDASAPGQMDDSGSGFDDGGGSDGGGGGFDSSGGDGF